ncbi:MAG: hypothetical protein WCH86_03390 [Kiritimatiellales bacterium]
MKRFIVPAVIASLISGAAFAQSTQVVSSVNVVGYNQIAILSNQFVMVAMDFDNGTNNTVNGLFGTLPTGSSVSIWDSAPAPAGQKWVVVNKIRTGWNPSANATNVIPAGSGVFIKGAFATNIYLAGNVPTNTTMPVITASNLYKILSYPYPVDMTLTNTLLGKGAATGDSISLWVSNKWSVFNKIRTGWNPSTATNVQLKVGDAVFYKAVTNRTVNELRPYTNSVN